MFQMQYWCLCLLNTPYREYISWRCSLLGHYLLANKVSSTLLGATRKYNAVATPHMAPLMEVAHTSSAIRSVTSGVSLGDFGLCL